MVDLLPEIEVVAEDAFNSSPSDPKLMGPEALERFKKGEELPVARIKTPLVCRAPSQTCPAQAQLPVSGQYSLPQWQMSMTLSGASYIGLSPLTQPISLMHLRNGGGCMAGRELQKLAATFQAEAILLSPPAMQVELPLGATEDRICGTINIEKALQEGVKAYEPGLLVSAVIHVSLAIERCPPQLEQRL